MNNNKYPYESEFWVFFCDISFPTQKGFLCLVLYNRHLLWTTLCIWTVFDRQQFFLLREGGKEKCAF